MRSSGCLLVLGSVRLRGHAWQASAHAPEIREALRHQLDDPNQVNRMLATQALHLIEPDGDQRLELIRQRLLAETHPHIRADLFFQLGLLTAQQAAAVDGLVGELANSGHWPLAAPLTDDVQNTTEETDDDLSKRELLRLTAELLLLLAMRHDQPAATDIVHRWFTEPLDNPEAFHEAAFQLRNMGMLATDQAASAVAVKAFDLLRKATDQLVAIIEAQLSAAPSDNDMLKGALSLVSTVVDQLHFASGALDARQTTASGLQQQLESGSPPNVMFFDLAMPLVERMAQVHQPGITHQLVETLAHLAAHDPKRVLLAVHRAVPPGHLYEYEPLAVDLLVNLVQRYLAEYRNLVTTDNECLTALRELLEVFVRAGWPQAITLAYQLPDAFR